MYSEDFNLIPPYNVGIQLRGEIPYLEYVVHVANGRGSAANVIDANPDKAIGVHLFGRVPSGIFQGSLLSFDFYTDLVQGKEKARQIFGFGIAYAF
jgi:hypothetical protein